jgi:two-component system, NarL family, sensor histidine kinase DevS
MHGRDLDERRLRLLLEIGTSIVAELDSEVVLRRVLDAGRELTGARYAALGILDGERRQLERFITAGVDESTRQAIGELPRGRGILGELIRNPEPLRLADISEHPRSYGFPPEHPPMTTFLGAPILVRGEAWGNIYLTEKDSGEFDEADEQALLVLSRWVAIAVENASLYEALDAQRSELERAVANLEATVAITRAIGAETDVDRVLELIVKRGRALVDARLFLVLLPEGSDLVVACSAGEGSAEVTGRRISTPQTALGEILRTGHAERLTDSSSRMRLGLGDLTDRIGAAMLVPLSYHGRALGLLVALDRFDSTAAYSADDERLMRAFASSAATALATAQNVEAGQLRMSIAAADQERARWARELHDETLQGLGALQVMLTAALRHSEDAVRRAAELAIGQIETQVQELQGLITELRPAALDDLGLSPALDTLYARVQAAHGLEVTSQRDLVSEARDDASRLAPEIEGTIYRLVQEALTNIAKHANTGRAHTRITEGDGKVSIEIVDDGAGFDPGELTRGFGLVGMRERVELVGGSLEIDSRPGSGTRVAATLPARHREESDAEHRRERDHQERAGGRARA